MTWVSEKRILVWRISMAGMPFKCEILEPPLGPRAVLRCLSFQHFSLQRDKYSGNITPPNSSPHCEASSSHYILHTTLSDPLSADEGPGRGRNLPEVDRSLSTVVGPRPLLSCSKCTPPFPRASHDPDGRAERAKERQRAGPLNFRALLGSYTHHFCLYSHWVEFDHMTRLHCKGGWEILFLILSVHVRSRNLEMLLLWGK